MQSVQNQLQNTKNSPLASYSLLAIFAVFTVWMSSLLYLQTRSILTDKLKERVTAIAVTAALQFDPNDIEEVVDENSVGSESFIRMTRALQNIRNANHNVYYAYLLRPTDDPNFFTYIVDADSIDPNAAVDLNSDGVIDDADALNTPGDEFDATEIPSLQDALQYPTTDPEPIEVDAYGVFMSGYAPIKVKGETVAVLALDIEVSDFNKLVSATLRPFIIFVGFLLLILASQTVTLVRMWGSRVLFFQEIDRQKDELLGLVSHQLATPVSSIKWYLEMLKDGDLGVLNKEQKEHVDAMHGIGESMSDLVSMILDVSRIQLGKMRIEKQDLDLNDFFRDIMTTIEPKALEKKVIFTKTIPEHLPVAKLDRRYTNMTIENLLSNAVKYTPEGGKVSCEVTVADGRLRVKVVDTGIGIPKAEQAKIFGRMFRASNASNAIDGNGFGLFVAKGAVEAQGGKIWFASEEAKGTTFYIDLPLA